MKACKNWSMTLRLFRGRALLRVVGAVAAKEGLELGLTVLIGLRVTGMLQRRGAILRRHKALDQKLLLGGERDQLIGRLRNRQIASGTLRGIRQLGQSGCVGLDVLDNLALHLQRVLV